MDEYIDRQSLLANLEERQAFLVKEWGYRDHYTRGFEDAVARVHDAPAADVSPVRHGWWTAIDASYWRWTPEGAIPVIRNKYKHEECGKVVSRKEKYCPNCGAKMDGGDGGDDR